MSARNPYLNGRMKDIPGLSGAVTEPLTTSSVIAKTGILFAAQYRGDILTLPLNIGGHDAFRCVACCESPPAQSSLSSDIAFQRHK